VRLLGKRRRFLAAGPRVTAFGLYTFPVGAEAAVVRAALMGALVLFARQVSRQQDGLNSQGLVATPMALANPNIRLTLKRVSDCLLQRQCMPFIPYDCKSLLA
jgi:predicted membrane metal-binding protein